ncbi:NADH-quinone oxidoreductase subunit C [Gemmatimonadota bacterium]
MTGERSSFDAVVEGPNASRGTSSSPVQVGSPGQDHATVLALKEKFPDVVLRHEVQGGDEHVVFIPPERNLEVLGWLKKDPDQAYDLLRDVTGVDYGGGQPLQVVYQLFSVTHSRFLRVKCELPLDNLNIESVFGLWKAANWLEREVFDLFGVTFLNHPDLRRILMPEDYAEGYPLRKDFPLRGRFSRAEQTRLALSQDLGHYYISEEILLGGESQALPPALPRGESDDEETVG